MQVVYVRVAAGGRFDSRMRFLSSVFLLCLVLSEQAGEAVVYAPPPFHFGNFSQLREYSLHDHSGFLTADLNLDGREDVVAWNDASRRVVVYHSDAAGNLEAKQTVDLPLGPEEQVIFIRFEAKIADVNADGRPDLALLEEGTARFHFLETQADGLLGADRVWRNSSFTYALDWVVADINLDGLADLAFSEDEDKFVVAIQRPGFVFERQWWPTSATFPGFEGRGVSFAALDGGALPDFAWTVRNARGERRTLLYRNEGETRVLPGIAARLNGKTGAFVWGELTPDLNGDKLPDLLQRDEGKQTITVFQGTGSEVFKAMSSVSGPVFGAARWLDFDGDGTLDLLQEDGKRACYALNDGKGKLSAPACESYEELGLEISSVGRADLNGDRLLDRVLLVEKHLRVSLAGRMLVKLAAPKLPTAPYAAQAWKFEVTAEPGRPSFFMPRGEVTLERDGVVVAEMPLVAGKASATLELQAGQYELAYEYAGERNFAQSISEKVSLTLAPHATETALTMSAAAVTAAQELKATIAVKAKSAVPGGSVSLVRDGVEVASLPLKNGAAVWSAKNLTPGLSQWRAVYVPNRNFFESASVEKAVAITGAIRLVNILSERDNVAPGSIGRILADGYVEGVAAQLQVGALRFEVKAPLQLPAELAVGNQAIVLTQGNKRWEGRTTVGRQAPGITVSGAYWTQWQGATPLQMAAVNPAEYFAILPWLTATGKLVTLTLYGTGWRNASAASQIAVSLNNTRLAVLAYGAHESLPGIDFLTVQVPSTFRPPSASTLTPYTRLQVSSGNVASNAIDLLLR